jgi:hypothetical protein
LRKTVQEIEDLRNEEQHQGLAEMAKNGNNSKTHSREVSISISHKNLEIILISISK